MNPDQQALDAFVDGELTAQEMERIAAVLETRPDLNRYVLEQEKLRASLRDAFASTITLPASSRLVRTVQTAPVSWRWRLRAILRGGIPLRVLLPAGGALAMGVALGILLRPATYFSPYQSGGLVAKGPLDLALNTQLASMRYVGKGPRIGISFRNKAGHDCRTFSFNNSSGLACHENGAWVIGLLVKNPTENSGAAYQMAGSTMPKALRQAVRASITGSPFDASAEEEARDRGWSAHSKDKHE
jgi:hypothetical protein